MVADHKKNTVLRNLMPALGNKVYFNYGGQGPLPNPSLKAIIKSWETIQELGPFTSDIWSFMAKEILQTKQLLAQICGVNPARIALTENVTAGCVLPLWGLPFLEEEEILISDCEHPGILAACYELAKRRKLKIKTFKVQDIAGSEVGDYLGIEDAVIESVEKSLTSKTRLVVLSHILWNTGQVMPICKLAERLSIHNKKPYFLVDAAQSFGQISVSKEASIADIYAFTGHKWACGPEGLGGVCLSKRVIEDSSPTLIGWRSIKNEEFNLKDTNDVFYHDARKFELATSCIPLLAGLRSSLELLGYINPTNQQIEIIQSKSKLLWIALRNSDLFTPTLKTLPPTGIVSFTHRKGASTKKIVSKLGEKGIWIRDLEYPNCLRACIHITTTNEEIRLLSEELNLLKL